MEICYPEVGLVLARRVDNVVVVNVKALRTKSSKSKLNFVTAVCSVAQFSFSVSRRFVFQHVTLIKIYTYRK